MLKNNKVIKTNLIRVREDKKEEISDLVARESNLTIFLNQKKLITINCTPGHYKYLGIGFLYSMGILSRKEDINSVKIERNSLKVEVSSYSINKRFNSHSLIGVQKPIRATKGISPVINSKLKISFNTIYSLISEMQERAIFFKLSGGVHSCALASTDGVIQLFSEDISRYNAIDRVLGEALLKNIATDDKMMLVSCRITSGIIKKIIAGSIPIIVSRAAPTDRAIKLAHQGRVTLIGFVRGKRMNIYTHHKRIIF